MKKYNLEDLLAGGSLTAILLLFGSFLFDGATVIAALAVAFGILGAMLLLRFLNNAHAVRKRMHSIRVSYHFLKQGVALTMAVLMIIMLPVQVLAVEDINKPDQTIPETTAETLIETEVEGQLVSLRERIELYLQTYQLSQDMSDSDLANAYFTLDSDGAKAAWAEANELLSLAGKLSSDDVNALAADENSKLCLRFYDVMCLINNPVLLDTSTPIVPVSGVEVSISGGAEQSEKDGLITVTASADSSDGCGGTTYTAKEITITISYTIDSTAAKNLEFNWSWSGWASVTIDGTAKTDTGGQYSKTIEPSTTVASFTIMLTTPEDATSCNFVMDGFSYAAAQTSATITVNYDTALGSVTYPGSTEALATGSEIPITADTVFTASPATGVTFLGWINANGVRVSTETVFTAQVSLGNQTLTPMFNKSTTNAWFLAGGTKYYDDLNAAVAFAATANDKTVILAADGTLPADDYSIPNGVTLLIPFDTANTCITDNAENYVVTDDETKLFRQLTMVSDTTITVNGALCIGSKSHRQMKGQIGPYGAIVMDAGSSITINANASLYAYGYIFPGDGIGAVTVKSGATVYEQLMLMDYPGSASNTWSLYNDNDVFPMRAYTIRNVEVPMTLEYGATEYVFYHFYGTSMLVGDNPGYVRLVGESTEEDPCPFSLKEGATLTKSYSNGKQIVTVNGDCSINAIKMLLRKSYEVSSADTTGFPMPSNFDITLDNGIVDLGGNVIMTKGCKITIGKNATTNINGHTLYIFAKNEAGAVSATDVHGTSYGKVDTDAILDVNGTLNVSGGLYISGDGSSIISSKGTGTVNIQNAISQTKVKIKTGQNAATEYDVYPAKLLDGDNTIRVDIATSGIGVYKYVGTGTAGKWHKDCDGTTVATNITLPTYTTPGEQTVKCQCELINEKQSIPKVVQLAAFAASAAEEIILDLKVNVPDTVTKLTVKQECLEKQKLITETKTYTINVSEKTVTPDDSSDTSVPYFDETTGRLIVSRGVASGEMTLPVTLTFQDKDGNTVLFRPSGISKVSELEGSLSRTVVDYAKLVQDKGTPEQKALIQALVTYGGYAQILFNVDSTNPAYSILGTEAPDLSAVTIPSMNTDTSLSDTLTPSGTISGLTIAEKNQAYLDSAIYFRVYFTITEGSVDDYTVSYKVPVNNKDGKTVILTPQPEGDRYYVDIPDIPSGYLDYPYSITFQKGSETVTLKASVLANLKRILESEKQEEGATPAQLNMAKAMYLYNQAANTYFGK